MPIPSSDELLELLSANDIKSAVRDYIIGGEVFIFQNFPEDEEPFYNFLCSNLPISRENIFVVGSAKLGYSCAPHKYGRQFNNNSDIDVAIVDETLFDQYWHSILDWVYSKRGTIEKYEKDKIKEYRVNITKGFIDPSQQFPKDLPRRDFDEIGFRALWQTSLRGLSSLTESSEIHLHDVKARLYRTKEHALLYHFDGMRNVALGREQ